MSSKAEPAAVGNALTPKLRFPEFRDAAGWESKTLADVCSRITQGGTPDTSKSEYWGGSINWMTPAEMGKTESPFIKATNRTITESGLSNCSSDLLPVNSVILSVRAPIGSLAINAVPMAMNQGCKGLIAGKSLDFYFLYCALAGSKPRLIDLGAGNTFKELSGSALKAFEIPVPSPAEQQKIADCLTSVDELIAAQARKVDALKTHKKGLMQQLFPREGETQPRLRFPEFQNAGDWEEVPLSELVSSLDAGVSVNSGDRPALGNEIGVLKTSAVTNGIFQSQENKVVFDAMETGRVKEPVQGDTIIISRMNTPALVGANAYVKTSLKNLFLPDRLWAAKSKSGTSMPFVALILGSDKGRVALSKLAKGSSGSMKNITKPDVLAFLIMAPSPDEQQHIANCLTSLDDLIDAQTQKLEALKTHKKGLMQQLFPSPEEAEA
ncbi:restriction endonuclease subunit S [Methylocapsa palsarum]|uniref:Type I restriction enzyme, S subunit n=1 Tax=Methylocapsa palsarum TaxID=1612308 RepID=A0A1I3ZP20_9HYPH|nr:restriction endonuclease subunit S [Methylocapsa palsarum]SFK45747.1 type I restriction enzyme, S subunit [Methylocapsa palsarum]